jgi:transposase
LRELLKLFALRMGSVTTPNKRRERLVALFGQQPELKPVMQPLIESIEALEAQIARSGKLLGARARDDDIVRVIAKISAAVSCAISG